MKKIAEDIKNCKAEGDIIENATVIILDEDRLRVVATSCMQHGGDVVMWNDAQAGMQMEGILEFHSDTLTEGIRLHYAWTKLLSILD